MTDERPMKDAPLDGTHIWARIDGHPIPLLIHFHDGFMDGDGNDCGSWCAVSEVEDEWPESWHGGVCWASNENEMPSDRPLAWWPS